MVERDLPRRTEMDQPENPTPQQAPIAPTSGDTTTLLLLPGFPRPTAAANQPHLQARSSPESHSCATRGMLPETRQVPRAGICHVHHSAALQQAV